MSNKSSPIQQWNVCADADTLDDALALLSRARAIIGPVSLRVRQAQRAAQLREQHERQRAAPAPPARDPASRTRASDRPAANEALAS